MEKTNCRYHEIIITEKRFGSINYDCDYYELCIGKCINCGQEIEIKRDTLEGYNEIEDKYNGEIILDLAQVNANLNDNLLSYITDYYYYLITQIDKQLANKIIIYKLENIFFKFGKDEKLYMSKCIENFSINPITKIIFYTSNYDNYPKIDCIFDLFESNDFINSYNICFENYYYEGSPNIDENINIFNSEVYICDLNSLWSNLFPDKLFEDEDQDFQIELELLISKFINKILRLDINYELISELITESIKDVFENVKNYVEYLKEKINTNDIILNDMTDNFNEIINDLENEYGIASIQQKKYQKKIKP